MDNILEMKGIHKEYPGVHALKGVDLTVGRGKVHCLMGENGAGKSTIIKILAGAESGDRGEIFFDGEKILIKKPNDALAAGISFIFQELSIIEPLSVEENITLGQEAAKYSVVDRKKNEKKVSDILRELRIDLDSKRLVRQLTTSQKQMVLIAKAFSRNSKLIVLDEPTAALTDKEAEDLFRLIIELKERGVSFLFVSHKFEDIFRIGDTVTVFRDGENVGERIINQISKDDIIRMMIGRDIVDVFPKRDGIIGEEVLRADNISARELIRDISFSLRRGEVLGVAGLAGSGKTELARALFGDNRLVSGSLHYKSRKVDIRSPIDAMKNNVALLPEERRSQGIVGVMNVRENISLASGKRISNNGVISSHRDRKMAKTSIERFNIVTPGPEQQIQFLSGGNQQKGIIAKWINTDAEIILLDEPTRGIDVGAKKEIYELISEITNDGKAVMMFSSELPELLGMCDNILVLYEGRLMGRLEKAEASQEKIMKLAVGG